MLQFALFSYTQNQTEFNVTFWNKPPIAHIYNARFRGSVGQLKLLSRFQQGIYGLCYRTKPEKFTFNYCNFFIMCKTLSLKGRVKIHFLQVECESSSRPRVDPDLQIRGG